MTVVWVGSWGGAGTHHPKRDETADVSMVQRGSMPNLRHGLGDATGARSGPLAKIAVLHRTSCASA